MTLKNPNMMHNDIRGENLGGKGKRRMTYRSIGVHTLWREGVKTVNLEGLKKTYESITGTGV